MDMKRTIIHLLSIGLLTQINFSVLAQNQALVNDKFLLVLDVQENFTKDVLEPAASETFIQNVNSVIKRIKPENVIYIESVSRALSLSFRGIKVDTLPNQQMDDRLNIVNENIFSKNEQNAFTSDEVINFLKKHNPKEIIVIGLAAEHCVYETLLGGKELGYEMHVVPEAIVGRTIEKKEKAIKKMMKKGIKQLPISEI